MNKTVLAFILKFILLTLAQVVIFNNLVLFNAIVPFVFIYIIISMPITWSTNLSVFLGFLAGVIIDIFSNTQGMNALSCTILAFIRKPIFHLYVQRDEDLGGIKPSQRSMGSSEFMKYVSTMTLIYCLCIFLIDAFAIFNPLRFIIQVLGSSIFTIVIIYALDSLFTQQPHEKRL